MTDILKLVSKVKRGKNRLKIFRAINEPIMPSELVKKVYGKNSNTYFNLVSRALFELKKLDLIEIINPEEKTGRTYVLTAKGKNVKKILI